MPVFVDPKTGEVYDSVPDDQVEKARGRYGLVSQEEYAEQQRPFSSKAAEKLRAGMSGLARGTTTLLAPAIDALAPADMLPAGGASGPMGAGALFTPEEVALREKHPFTAAIAEGAPIAALGAATGGLGLGALGTAGALGVEAAASGVSQEAIDATMGKRDRSAKAALWNGVLDLIFGALGFGAGKVIGRIGGAADEAAGLPGKRNFIAEIDSGAMPEPRTRSAGAAAAANRNYVGDASEEFTDDVWDAAVKSIDDQKLDAEARYFSNPQTSNALLELGSMNAADSLDDVRRVLRDDAGLGVKIDDMRKGSAAWTPEIIEAQRKWVDDQIVPMANAAADAVKTIDGLGGFQSKAIKTLGLGMKRVLAAQGAERNIAADQLKRSVAGVISDLSNDFRTDIAAKGQLLEVLKPLHDEVLDGLQDEAKFGANAILQKATNEPLHRMIEPMKRVDSKLAERLGARWGEVGQAAVDKRTRAAAVKSLMQAEPSTRREILQDLTDALDGAEDLARAREAHGLSRLDNLPRIVQGIKSLKNDLNMATVIQTAQRRAGEGGGGLGKMAADVAVDQVAGRIPVVGGALKRGSRGLLDAVLNPETMPRPGTPLRQVLDDRLKSYSRLPELANAGFSRPLLSEQMRQTLRGHGGQVAGVAGVVGAGAALMPGEAGATELPERRMQREAYAAKLGAMPPEDQGVAVGTAEAMARIASHAEARVKAAIGSLFGAKDRSFQPPRDRAIEKRSAELDLPRAVARFMGPDTDDPVEAWQEKREMLRGVVEDPQQLIRAMTENLGRLPQIEPELFTRMVAQTMGAVEWLHARAPAPAGTSVMDPKGYPPTLEEITAWAGDWVGALHPLDTLDDLAANDLVPEQLEAVKALHADAFALFQQTALSEIGRARKSRRRIPMQDLERIDSALELDGAGDTTLSWDMARLIQRGEQEAAQTGQQPPQMSPMQSKGAERTASSALASIRPEAGAL